MKVNLASKRNTQKSFVNKSALKENYFQRMRRAVSQRTRAESSAASAALNWILYHKYSNFLCKWWMFWYVKLYTSWYCITGPKSQCMLVSYSDTQNTVSYHRFSCTTQPNLCEASRTPVKSARRLKMLPRQVRMFDTRPSRILLLRFSGACDKVWWWQWTHVKLISNQPPDRQTWL